MPDLNLDTLFIIGLVLASLIGKFFRKKESTEPSEKNVATEPTLEDALKGLWQKATQGTEEKIESTHPLPSSIKPVEKFTEKEKPSDKIIISDKKTAVGSPLKSPAIQSVWNSQDTIKNKQETLTYKKLLSSKRSLRQAFVLREILGQPISIRQENH